MNVATVSLSLRNQIALITGGGRGIGAATAQALASRGAHVIVASRTESELSATVAEIQTTGLSASAIKLDVADETEVDAAFVGIAAAFGRLDILVNAAGIIKRTDVIATSDEAWRQIFGVNVDGIFFMCRAALPHLVKTKGCLVNTSSTAALGSHPWMAAYAASKGGILSMTRSIAVEYVKQGVRANCVCPGGVATPLHGQFRLPKGADAELLRGAMPMVAYVGPEHAASVIAFLASDDARYITGTEIRADGGALS